jgi:hypothetical protein
MTSDPLFGWHVGLVAVPAGLWALLGALLLMLRRRGNLPAGAGWVCLITGVAAQVYPLLMLAGFDLPWWALIPGNAVVFLVGYGYMLAQLHKHNLRWGAAPPAEVAGVDAPARDETETP